MRDVRATFREAAPPAVVVQEVPNTPFARGAGHDLQPTTPSLTMTATVGELGPNPVRHLGDGQSVSCRVSDDSIAACGPVVPRAVPRKLRRNPQSKRHLALLQAVLSATR